MDLLLTLEEASRLPLHRQLFDQLRQAVLAGRVRPGERLPSTRSLAQRLGVSRQTVCLAYDQLLAEGYLVGRRGSGTFVSAHLPDEMLQASPPSPSPRRSVVPSVRAPERLSAWARRLPREQGGSAPPAAYDFRLGSGDWEAFPWGDWRRLLARRLRRPTQETTAYGHPAGYAPLRAAIAAHLGRSRAVRCSPEQVVIVSGTQQSLDLLARILVDSGDRMAMEDPGYPGARRVFQAYGAQVLGLPVDEAGLLTQQLPRPEGATPWKLLYVTPSHQFPTGATLSLPRRLELLEWAARAGALVLEDDYDSEFRYGGRPLESLQGLDGSGSVVYMSSFSEALFPSLRVGYVVLPEGLLGPFLAAKELSDRQTPTLEQQVLADFLASGLYERHLRRMRKRYASRREALLDALARHFGPGPRVTGAAAGMHVALWLPAACDEQAAVREAERRGVGVQGVRAYFWSARPVPGLLLGYASLDETRIQRGIARLAEAVEACLAARAGP